MPLEGSSEPGSTLGGARAFFVFGRNRSTFGGSGAFCQRMHRALDDAIYDTVPRERLVADLGLERGHPWGILGH